MKISAKIDYACRALLELSLHWPKEEPLRVCDIAKRQKIPENFLVQILISLKQLNYIQSMRGKKGGYVLAKTPKEINLWEVYFYFSEQDGKARLAASKNKSRDVIEGLWHDVNIKIKEWMSGITFSDLILKHQDHEKILSFNI